MIRDIENGLKKIIENIVEGKILQSPQGMEKSIDVFIGYIPYEDEQYITPAISIRIIGGENTVELRKLNCHIVFQMYNDTSSKEAYDLLTDIGEELVDKIIEHGTVENIAEITPNIKWEVPEQQPIPYYIFNVSLELISRKAYRTDVDEWINGRV